MELFRDQKTGLAFPLKIHRWNRFDITTYPVATAGYSVIYRLSSWLGGIKANISVDVYDKGIAGIPDGPHSPVVAIELQNCLRVFLSGVPVLDPSRLEAYLAGNDDLSDVLVGEIDPQGIFKLAGGDIEVQGRKGRYLVLLTGHRNHLVKLALMDFTLDKAMNDIGQFVGYMMSQLKSQG